MRLYRAHTTADELTRHGGTYRDVVLTWFVTERRRPLSDPVNLVKGYDHALKCPHDTQTPEDLELWNRCTSQHCALESVNEAYTGIEVEALREYLAAVHEDQVDVSDFETPIDIHWPNGAGILPIGAIAVGGATDFYMMSKEPEWHLPFGVDGYFDVSRHECDEPPRDDGLPSWAVQRGPFIFV